MLQNDTDHHVKEEKTQDQLQSPRASNNNNNNSNDHRGKLRGLLRRKAKIVRVLCRVSLAFSQCAREAGVHAPLSATAAVTAGIGGHEQPTLARFYSESDGYLEFDVAEYRFSAGDEYRWPRYAIGPVLRLPQHRTQQDVDCIRTLMRQLKFCRRLPEQVLQRVAEQTFYMRLEKGRDVLREGHIGYSFYIIFSGRVVIRTSGSSATNSESVRLSKGDAFGERALLFHTSRNATVTTETPLTEFLIIYDECFAESGLAEYFRARIDQIDKFLRSVPLLASLDQTASSTFEPIDNDGGGVSSAEETASGQPSCFYSLASSCVQLDYLDGCEIVADSRRTDCVWFLMSGSADCCRLLADEADWFVARVGRLAPGSAFGLAAGPNANRAFRLVSRGCRMLAVSRATLTAALTPAAATVAAEAAAVRQPSDSRLRRACRGQTDWQRWRRSEVLATVRRLQGVDGLLNKPINPASPAKSGRVRQVNLPKLQQQASLLQAVSDTKTSQLNGTATWVQRSFTTFEMLNRIK